MDFDHVTKSDIYKQFWSAMNSTTNTEFWALKTQIYIEHRLKHLLAVRLNVPSVGEEKFLRQVDTINYHHLVHLAFPSSVSERLRSHLIKLNNVRKEIAHRLHAENYASNLRTFVEAVSTTRPWPSTPEEQNDAVKVALAVLFALVEFAIRDVEEPRWSDTEENAP